MITLIIGQNAIGKTVYLRNKVKEVSVNHNVITNLTNTNYLTYIPYNRERIEHLKEILDTEEITENNELLHIVTDELNIGKSFTSLLTIICKDLDYLYIDEPEFCLSYREIGFLIWFLSRIEDTFKEIVIVTHSEMILSQLLNKNIKTIKYDDTDKQFIAIDLEEDAYVTID